jgi:nitroreductase
MGREINPTRWSDDMDVHTAINTRRSVREFSSQAIPDPVVLKLKAALRAAPSAGNLQPRRFIFVHDAERRKALGKAANGQTWISDAPVIVVACGMSDQAHKLPDFKGTTAVVDTAIAVDHLTLAAVAEGVGSCWIGAFDDAAVRQIMHVPAKAEVVALVPLGYPADPNAIRPLDELERRDEAELICDEQYVETGRRITQ